jgi:cysteine desulfurase
VDPIYLDHNATTRPSPAVIEAVARGTAELWANPSSVHRGGQNARAAIELARAKLATLIGAKPRDLVLTSSCTEAIDMGVRGVLEAGGKNVLVTSAVEHAAVRELADDLERAGTEVRNIPVLAGGVYDTDAAAELIDNSVGVVAVQWANNETGAIQPIRALGTICTEHGVPLLVDGAQYVGKRPVKLADDDHGIDLLALSPHKFHGPKGVGVLWARRGIRLRPRVLGSQELGRRGGTENTPGIMGAGVAADEAAAWLSDPANPARVAALRDRLEQRLLAACPDAVINRPPTAVENPATRLSNTTNIGFCGLQAESILMQLSERGDPAVLASAGAACSSGSLDPSPVLLAMGVPERIAHGSIRLSLGRETTADEVDRAAAIIAQVVRASGIATD